MEVVGIIVAYFVIQVVWNVISNNIQQSKIDKEREENVFSSKVSEDVISGDEFNWNVFHIKMKGIVDCPSDNTPVKYVVQLMDVTNDKKYIFSNHEDFQYPDSVVFRYESEEEVLPYVGTIFKNWSTVLKLPIIFLEFPRSGKLIIESKVFIVNKNTDYILAEHTSTFSYLNDEKGYVDRKNDRKYLEEMIIKSAMLVSASDGDMDLEEANVVKLWIKKRLYYYSEESEEEEKSRLNGYVKEAYQEIESDDIDIYEVLEGIENIATEGEKFELFQMCLDVAQADGEADESELTIVHEIANLLKLDQNQFRKMIEKTLPITIHSTQVSDEALLGLTENMTDKEAKKHLREQYKKWNARVASSDSDIREQAEKMIHLIAETRKKYT